MVGVYFLLFAVEDCDWLRCNSYVVVDCDWLYFCTLQDVTENKNMPLMNLSSPPIEKASLQPSQEDSNGVYEL